MENDKGENQVEIIFLNKEQITQSASFVIV